jgi:D-aminoacyl-tRNA deacylase
VTVAIVVSRADYASVNIGEQLLDQVAWTEREDDSRPDAEGGGTYYRHGAFELREFEGLHIELDDPAPAFADADGTLPNLLVFVSRHAGDTGALLTGHFTGNFGDAEYGGSDWELAETAPSALSAYIGALAAHAPESYEVAVECTHHGPTDVSCPSMFAELGSGDEQWDDPAGARAVAQAVLSLRGVAPNRDRQVVGLGGGHYAPRFGRIVRETPWAVGHIGSDWQLAELDSLDTDAARAVLDQAFTKSHTEYALVDGDNQAVRDVVSDLGYRVVTETWIREVGSRPLALVEALEAELSTVEAGLRFGRVTVGDDGEWSVASLPADLLAEAQGIDAEAARDAVEVSTVAFETEHSGTRAAGCAAFGEHVDRRTLVESLAEILAESYDSVEVTDDAVLASETAFDPERARTLGVSDGPKMGRLAAGEPVEVRGKPIDPEAVCRERTVEFSY